MLWFDSNVAKGTMKVKDYFQSFTLYTKVAL